MDEQMVAFREWYNAQWLGDQEHGQYIPHNGDPKYTEYLDGHMLALGAWIACLQYNGVAANKYYATKLNGDDDVGKP